MWAHNSDCEHRSSTHFKKPAVCMCQPIRRRYESVWVKWGLFWRWVHFKLDSVIFIVKLYSTLTYRLLLCFLLFYLMSLLSNPSCWKVFPVTVTSPTRQFLVKLHLHFISRAFVLLKTASLISQVHKLQFFCFEQWQKILTSISACTIAESVHARPPCILVSWHFYALSPTCIMSHVTDECVQVC